MGRSSTSLRYCGTKTDTTSPEWLDPRLHISPTPGTLTARQCRDASRQTLQAHLSSREAIRRGAGTPAPIPRAMPPAGSCAIAMSRTRGLAWRRVASRPASSPRRPHPDARRWAICCPPQVRDYLDGLVPARPPELERHCQLGVNSALLRLEVVRPRSFSTHTSPHPIRRTPAFGAHGGASTGVDVARLERDSAQLRVPTRTVARGRPT